MKIKTCNRQGFTLIEILMAAALMSVVFLGVSAIYLTTLHFYKDLIEKQVTAQAMLAVEEMERMMTFADEVIIETNTTFGDQIQLRLDETPEDPNDSTHKWVKYCFIEGSLRTFSWPSYKGDPTGKKLTTSEPEVIPGLKVDTDNAGACVFTQGPRDVLNLNTIKIQLTVLAGETSFPLETEVMLRGMSSQ